MRVNLMIGKDAIRHEDGSFSVERAGVDTYEARGGEAPTRVRMLISLLPDVEDLGERRIEWGVIDADGNVFDDGWWGFKGTLTSARARFTYACDLLVPTVPGDYELQLRVDGRVVASCPIFVVPAAEPGAAR